MASEQLEEVTKFQRATNLVDLLGSYEIDYSFYQHLQAAYVIHDFNTKVVAWNQQALDLLGMSANSILGKSAMDPHWHFVRENESLMPHEEYPVNKVITTGESLRNYIVGIIKSENAPLVWVQVSADPIFDNSRRLRYVMITFMDVTERIKAQKQLARGEKRYRSLINVMQDALIVYDSSGVITECNPAAEWVLGVSMEQICGSSDIEAKYGVINESGGTFPVNLRPANVTLRTGKAQKNIVMGINRPDGTLCWVTANSAPIFEVSNYRPSAVVVTLSDITSAKTAYRLLMKNEELLRGLVTNSPLAKLIVSTQKPNLCLLVSKRFTELFGYTLDDVSYMDSWWETAIPNKAYREKCISTWNSRILEARKNNENRILPIDIQFNCRDGSVRYIEVHTAILDKRALVIFNDLTDRKLHEQKLNEAAAVFENTSEGVMITDHRENIIAVNKAFTDITGYTFDEVVGRTPAMLGSDRHDTAFYNSMWSSINKTGNWQGEIWNRRSNGELYPVWLTISAIKEKDGDVTRYVAVFSDITSVKQSEERLYRLAHHDALTSLPNRLQFITQAEHTIQRARRNQSSFAIMFVDLDRFKHINDSMGHPVGDQIILEVANRLKKTLRDNDTVARLGGDEFTVLIEDFSDTNNLSTVAKKLIENISRPIKLDGHEYHISASVGISVFPQDGKEINALISNADAAMYRAKELGRSSYQFYTRDMTENALERATIETKLRNAIEKGEMTVLMQPRFNITTRKLVGAEALLHWNNAEQGNIPAAKFIPLAEEIGSINQLGDFVLQNTCEFAHRIALSNIDRQGRFRLSINLSTFQLTRRNIFSRLTRIIKASGCNPLMLEFELTESMFAKPAERLVEIMKKFREFGVSIAVDNFGVGYSSLSNLRKFPLDRLKIDVSFVSNIPDDLDDIAIARAVIALSHSLHLKVVAAGVETEMQHKFLVAEGCNEAQGYYYSKPVPMGVFQAKMADWL